MYGVLSWRVCSDQQHFWVSALGEVSRGEASPLASGDRASNLTAANTHLHRALSALKVNKGKNTFLNYDIYMIPFYFSSL